MNKIPYPIPTLYHLIPDGHINKPSLPNTWEHQIVHGTGNIGHGADDVANAAYFRRPFRKIGGKAYAAGNDKSGKPIPFRCGSVHKIIDRDSVTISIRDLEGCYGAGDRPNDYNNGCKGQTPVARDVFGYRQNYRAIQYELAMDGDWDKVLDNAVEVIAIDYVNYNMTGSQWRHEDVTGKACPGWLLDDRQWQAFKARIAKRIEELKEEQSMEKIDVVVISGGSKVVTGFLKDGITYVPVRPVAEGLGAKVAWDASSNPKKVTVSK